MNKIIPPTVGRQVHFHLASADVSHIAGWNGAPNNTYAATVAFVHSDCLVNLCVLDACGYAYGMQSIPLCQPGDERPLGNWCEWMSYQKGQAAKTEKAELTAENLLRAIGTRMNEALAKDPHAFTREQVMTIFGLRDVEPREVFAPPAGEPPTLNTLATADEVNRLSEHVRMEREARHPAIAATQQLDNDGNPLAREPVVTGCGGQASPEPVSDSVDNGRRWSAPTIPQD